MATDFEAEGLLEGLDGRAKEARRQLLEQLEGDGVRAGRAAPGLAGGSAGARTRRADTGGRRGAPHAGAGGRADRGGARAPRALLESDRAGGGRPRGGRLPGRRRGRREADRTSCAPRAWATSRSSRSPG
ncbi:MAG: hypothetical protein WKF40_00720 [Thermoleophilaceae bacterium]